MTFPEILEKLKEGLDALSGDPSARGLAPGIVTLVNEGLDAERNFAKKEFLRELKILFLEFDADSEVDRARKLARAKDVLVSLARRSVVQPEVVRAVSAPAESEPEEPRRPQVTPPSGTPIPLPAGEGDSDLPAPWSGDPRFAEAAAAREKLEREEKRALADAASDAAAEDVVEEGEAGDEDDGVDDTEEDEQTAEVRTGDRPDVRADGAPVAGTPAAPGAEGGRRRRRRGGRRRRKHGEGDAPAAPGAVVAAAAVAEVPAPRVTTSGSANPLGGMPHPEVGTIQILGMDPPIPTRRNQAGPVVRPGSEPLPEDYVEREVTGDVPLPADLVGALGARTPVAPAAPPPEAPRAAGPKLDDVKNALARLSSPVTEAEGVGPKSAELFAGMGIRSIEDALFDLPRGYQDRSHVRKISEIRPGQTETVLGTVKSRGMVRLGLRSGFELVVEDGTGEVRAKWFHVHRGIEDRFPIGAKVVFAGKFELFKGKLETTHPEIEVLEEGDGAEVFARVTPVYALTDGISQKVRRKIQDGIVDTWGKDVPPATPFWLRQKRSYLTPSEAIQKLAAPESDSDVAALVEHRSPAHRSLAYDELFALQVGLALKRRAAARDRAIPLKIMHGLSAKLAAFLPYPLTDAQEKTLAEIKRDLMHARPMHRLLQGDVGSGKTIVALMAALVAIENRTQVAMMAPTEILAEQHFQFARATIERLGVRVALLLGQKSDSGAAETRADTLKKITHGDIDLVIGTHALIQEGVQFKNLGLAIIDEQHRFGVMQRAALKQKGGKGGDRVPHVLIMTATPIPRTLALTEFGDLDLSVIDKLPPGRSPVETRVCGEEERSTVWAQVRSDVSSGRQAFVIFPVVHGGDGAEHGADEIASATEGQKKLQRDVFPEFRVGLLHGQMSREEKEGVMTRFKNGAVDILAATTVIEVGIDVPNATVLVVEHSERFGLAQLHQLRGRVGRGAAKSRAFFMVGKEASDEARERLGTLERTSDGFEVAQVDLEMRGMGDVVGKQQAGIPPFRVADPLRDMDIMVQAREDAFAMVNADPKLREPEHRVVHEVIKHRWKGRLVADA